jgi:hypothetical protein
MSRIEACGFPVTFCVPLFPRDQPIRVMTQRHG